MRLTTYFIEKADQLFRLAKETTEASIPRKEIGAALETMGDEFMAKAVEIDTARDKATKSG